MFHCCCFFFFCFQAEDGIRDLVRSRGLGDVYKRQIKMYELAGEVVDALQEGGMLFIDEFNSGLHPQLCEYIIGLFRKKSTNPHGAQLVVVNHDTNLMAQDDIYRDEIWLVDRNEYGESELYSIDEFSKNEVRKGTNLEKWYLDGRFKAIPSIFPSEFKLEISK